jgi:phage virion morphogenesis protein
MLTTEFKATASTRAIREAIAHMEDMTPIFHDVAEYMTEATRKRFVQGKAPDGTSWAAKRPSTLERYKRLGYGNLNRPLIGHSTRLLNDIVSEATRSGAVIGSALIYSRVMQEGAEKGAFGADRRGRPIPWGRIPARVWLGISAEDHRAIVEIVDEHLAADLGQG